MKRVIGVVLLVAATLFPASNRAGAAPTFIAYGADASGTAVHLVGITNSLSNFRNGFLDNYFPLAATHLDASPATTAAATIADTGPGGGFVDFEVNGKLPQTQYALAGQPGVPSASLSQQGTIITAAATTTSADARAAAASTTSGGPTAKASPAAPVNTDGDAGESHVIYDAAAGTIDAVSAGTLGHVAIAGGLVTIDSLTVTASVVATASGATPTYAINAAGVKVAGQAVSITDKGVVPVGGSPPTPALNQVLAQAGISLSTVAPVITRNGANATVDATGITVSFTAPNPNPSIPTLTTKVILGEARAFAFATPAPPPAPPVTGPSAEAPVVVPDTTPPVGVLQVPAPVTVTTSPPLPNQVAAPAATQPVAAGFRLVTERRRPSMLLWIYLAWQVIIIANGAAIVWWRRRIAR